VIIRSWLYLTFFLLFTPLSLFAGGVFSTNSCLYHKVENNGTVTAMFQSGPVGCEVGPPGIPNEVHASTFVNVALPAAGQSAVPVSDKILASVQAASNTGLDVGEGTAANAFGSLDYTLTTAGPIRPGLLYLAPVPALVHVRLSVGPDGPYGQDASAQVSIGSLQETCLGTGLTFQPCSGDFGSSQTYFPFTLGQDFLFHEGARLSASSVNGHEFQNAQVGIDFSFLLFEADGVTPVQIALATPEPNSSTLWAGGLLALLTLIPRSLHRGE